MAERILIVGGGAIGGVTAAHLTRAGRNVTVLDANAEHVRLMNSPGLQFDEVGTVSTVPIRSVSTAADLAGPFDFGLSFLKAPFLETALSPLVAAGSVDTWVTFGNGLVQDRVEAIVGPDDLLIGLVEWGATNLGPGRLQQTTRAPMVVGEPDGRDSERVRRLADALGAVAEVRVSTGILGQVWSKLLVNSTFSGLGAVAGLLYEEIAADPVGREAAYRLWTEGCDVASAAGVRLETVAGIHPDELVVRSPDDVHTAERALERVMSKLGATKASMLQDLERGVVTEVDVINGGVTATAARLGLAAPLNSRVVELVHACERGRRAPGREALQEIAEHTPHQ